MDPNIQNPTVFATGTQVERQLPRNITVFAGFYNIRIVHVIRARDINAPLPASITPITPNGIRHRSDARRDLSVSKRAASSTSDSCS